MVEEADVLIIGGGPAGLAAGIGAKKAGSERVLIVDRENRAGGILKQCIHNGFGLHTFKRELTGPEYAAIYCAEAEKAGVELWTSAMATGLSADRTVKVMSEKYGYVTVKAKAVVLAMGCRERPRGALGIPGERCAGIYTAGTAQKLVNIMGLLPGRRVVILGSGDIGLIMARRMTLVGAKVLACVEIMPYSSGLRRNIVQCLDDFDIPLYLSHTVTDIKGRERLESVTVAKVDECLKPVAGTEFDIPCDTLLLSVGLLPENELSSMAGIEISAATGGPIVDERLETSVEGVFACGNVLHVHDLVDNVSDEAERAGMNAAAYAAGKINKQTEFPIIPGNGIGAMVPDFISAEPFENVKLTFRPKTVYRSAVIRVRRQDEVVASRKAVVLTPGEMVSMNLNAAVLRAGSGALRVDIET